MIAALLALTLTAPPEIHRLRDSFVETIDGKQKVEILAQIERTPPTSIADVQALYDLFLRFPENKVRQAALSSLQLLDPRSAQPAEPLLLGYLQDEDPESVLFGLKGSLRLRSPQALSAIRKLAKKKFRHKSAGDAPVLSERNAWWIQYEALAALAQWEGKKALPLLRQKASEAPPVARLMGLFLWEESLPTIEKWAGGGASDAAKAQEALRAPTPIGPLRATRGRMLAIVRDLKAPQELRHQYALKVGACSTPEEVAALLKDYDAASDPGTRLLLAASAFASRDPQITPLLTRFAKEDPDPNHRAGALVQLRDMLPPAEFRALLQWVSQNDADAENKQHALRELEAGVRH